MTPIKYFENWLKNKIDYYHLTKIYLNNWASYYDPKTKTHKTEMIFTASFKNDIYIHEFLFEEEMVISY